MTSAVDEEVAASYLAKGGMESWGCTGQTRGDKVLGCDLREKREVKSSAVLCFVLFLFFLELTLQSLAEGPLRPTR